MRTLSLLSRSELALVLVAQSYAYATLGSTLIFRIELFKIMMVLLVRSMILVFFGALPVSQAFSHQRTVSKIIEPLGFGPRPVKTVTTLWNANNYDNLSTENAENKMAATPSQRLVSFLTDITNSIMERKGAKDGDKALSRFIEKQLVNSRPPSSPEELRERIAKDYTEKNYLWTGDIDLACFTPDCSFSDPTISFRGRETFVRNVQNLQPILDLLAYDTESQLLSYELYGTYIQTRWRMQGSLRLPWKPKINVIGRTKFRYDPQSFLVHTYDEIWEMPAYRALLQLVTPAGTFAPEE